VTENNEFASVDENTQPGKLRQLLEQALATNKQLTEKISALETAEAQRSVQATWNELKVPDAIRKLYNGDTSADAIKQWWEDSKGLFNIQAVEEQAPAVEQLTAEQQAAQQAAQQFQQASAIGTDSPVGTSGAAEAKVAEAKQIARTKGRGADFEAARQAFYEATGTRAY